MQAITLLKDSISVGRIFLFFKIVYE